MNSHLETTNSIVTELMLKTKDDNELAKLIELSIQKARSIALKELDISFYTALTWPVTIKEYFHYLNQFSKYTPNQSDKPIWQGQVDEVADMLHHFYWLINQDLDEEGYTLQDNTWFSDWLVRYVRSWGGFLDTTDSFNEDILDSFIKKSPEYRVEDSMIEDPITKRKRPNSPSGWLTFNQFFARELNPGLRPIDSSMDNSIVTCPADCTFMAKYSINLDSTIPEIIIKKTHKFSNIEELLKDSQYKSQFAGGTFIHYYLSPHSYHRFHFPVSGILKECYPVNGLVYANVSLINNKFHIIDESKGGFEFSQARGVLTVDTRNSPYGDIGIVAVIPIGMCQVSSVNMIAQPGSTFLKGDEFGYFMFGGSDIIVLFQAGVNPKVDENNHYRHYGTKIAFCEKK
jgi:phosphatidylserine decarboxylase precursor